VLNASSLGHYTAPPDPVTGPVPEPGVLQRFYLEGQNAWGNVGLAYNGTVFWNDRAYLWPSSLPVMAWPLNRTTSTFDCTRGLTYPDPRVPVCAGEVHAASSGFNSQRTNITVSADGARPGTGVLWSTVPDCDGELVAYDAENITAGPIYSSRMETSDHLGNYETIASPVVAGGRVFVVTRGAIVAYGPLAIPRTTLTRRPDSACGCPAPTLPQVGSISWHYVYRYHLGPPYHPNERCDQVPVPVGEDCSAPRVPTVGRCQDCHTSGARRMGTTEREMFLHWERLGLINRGAPLTSRIVSTTTSPLKWINPSPGLPMPYDSSPRCNVYGWGDLQGMIEDWARTPSHIPPPHNPATEPPP